MSNGFTPGPWEVQSPNEEEMIRAAQKDNSCGCALSIFYIHGDNGERTVATISGIYSGGRNFEIEKANAILIAQAPTLHAENAALSQVLRYLQTQCGRRFQACDFMKEGADGYGAVSDAAIEMTTYLREMQKFIEQALSKSLPVTAEGGEA